MNVRNAGLIVALGAALFAADPAVQKAQKLAGEKKYPEAITTLETALKANPKSAEVRKALGDVHFAHGDTVMHDESMPPRMKYPTALREFRQVLVYDKTNAKAQANIKMIEDIYKSMGRPVPQ